MIALGTAAVVRDEAHAHTYLALDGDAGFFLIDCADSPILSIRRAALDTQRLRGLIITHFHPDHVLGAPILLIESLILGRREPLPVYGLQDVVDRFATMMDLFRWGEWPELYPVPIHAIPEEAGAPVLEDDEFRITGAPVQHVVPNMGLRIESKRTGGVVAYSSDTAPCDAVADLARGADILIHEAAEATPGHSSAAQAGQIARRAGVGRLVLVHYRPAAHKFGRWVEEASDAFGGPAELAQDLCVYPF